MDFNKHNVTQNVEDLITEMLPFGNLTKLMTSIEYEGQEYQIQIVITNNEDDFIDE